MISFDRAVEIQDSNIQKILWFYPELAGNDEERFQGYIALATFDLLIGSDGELKIMIHEFHVFLGDSSGFSKAFDLLADFSLKFGVFHAGGL